VAQKSIEVWENWLSNVSQQYGRAGWIGRIWHNLGKRPVPPANRKQS